MVISWILSVFWSFFRFGGILVFFFRFWEYFGHLVGFEGILVIFWISRVFWSFFGFGGILVIFWVLGVFWSVSRNLDFMLFI